MNQFERVGRNFLVPLKHNFKEVILEYCSIPDTRQRIEQEFNGRHKDQGLSILEESLLNRFKVASALGYESYVDYVSVLFRFFT